MINRKNKNNRKSNKGSLTYYNKRLAQRIKMVNVIPVSFGTQEVKYYEKDLVSTFSSIGTSGVTYEFSNLIPQGTDNSSRIGNIIDLKFINVSFTMQGGQSGLGTDDPYNTLAIRVFSSPGTITPGTPSVCAAVNPLVLKSASIFLSDVFILRSFSYDSSTGGLVPAALFKTYRIPVDKKITYALGDTYGLHRFYIQIVSDSSAVTNPGLTSGKLTIAFTDS